MLINPYVFGSLWTPSYITTALWLDAADSSTITTVSGFVSQWNDKSGNGRHATQSTSGIRPTYASSKINFASQSLSVPVAAAPPVSATLISVLQSSSTGTNSAGLINIADSNRNNPEIRIGLVGGDAVYVYWGGAYVMQPTTTLSTAATIVALEFNGQTSPLGVSLYVNGSLVLSASRNAAWSAYAQFQLGRYDSPSAIYRNGSISEMSVFSTSSNTRQRMEGYLAWKWGLTANLPANHPYKSAAPTV